VKQGQKYQSCMEYYAPEVSKTLNFNISRHKNIKNSKVEIESRVK
jgi:hypothetical protein